MTRSRTFPKSTCDGLMRMVPVMMRLMSRRSATIWFWAIALLWITSTAWARLASVRALLWSNRSPAENGVERRSQLVGDHRHELVLGARGGFDARPLVLRRRVEMGVVDRDGRPAARAPRPGPRRRDRSGARIRRASVIAPKMVDWMRRGTTIHERQRELAQQGEVLRRACRLARITPRRVFDELRFASPDDLPVAAGRVAAEGSWTRSSRRTCDLRGIHVRDRGLRGGSPRCGRRTSPRASGRSTR